MIRENNWCYHFKTSIRIVTMGQELKDNQYFIGQSWESSTWKVFLTRLSLCFQDLTILKWIFHNSFLTRSAEDWSRVFVAKQYRNGRYLFSLMAQFRAVIQSCLDKKWRSEEIAVNIHYYLTIASINHITSLSLLSISFDDRNNSCNFVQMNAYINGTAGSLGNRQIC